jgi:hypothetical protein
MPEGLLLFEPMLAKKRQVEHYWQQYGRFNREPLTVAMGYEKYGFRITVSESGAIRGVNQDGTVFIILSPTVDGNVLRWNCYGSKVGNIPSGCRTEEEISGSSGTER